MTTERRSALYTGSLMHDRTVPARNRFRYRVMFVVLDVDELPALDRALGLFSYNARNVFSLRDADHIGDSSRPVGENIRAFVASEGGEPTDGPILLMTNLRFLGYVFNPVSFFYCHRSDGTLAHVVAEVANTFGERYAYLLTPGDGRSRALVARVAKRLHVSPFFDMDQTYEFAFSPVGRRMAARVDLFASGRRVFRAVQEGTRRPLTNATLAWTLVTHPFMAWRVTLLIHEQAVHLWRKGVGFHRKPPFDPDRGSLSMTTTTTQPTSMPPAAPRSRQLREIPEPRRTPLAPVVQRLVLRALERTVGGRLRLRLPNGSVHRFGSSGDEATITIRSRDTFHRLVQRGNVGLGEGYQVGDWDADDLPTALKFLAQTSDAIRGSSESHPIARLMAKRPHIPRANGLGRARSHIQYHYDLGNDLYELFLDDETWAYSCAIFDRPDEGLADAQRNKFARICAKLAIGPDDHVLEIGCGWGGFARYAAREHGARVTGVTISDEQHAFATERVRAEGLADRVTILLRDYRTIAGRFTKIASIEMFEAIGDREYGRFFATCDRLLEPGGWACVQTIAVPDQRFERYRRGHDWIREYIFPGAVIPSLAAMTKAMSRASQLIAHDVENIGIHYARTLRLWRERFNANRDRVLAIGFDDRFIRTWNFYLSFCEAGFSVRSLSDYQLVLSRPFNTALPVSTR